MTILRLAKRVPPLPGGQERHVLELTKEQAAAGHSVILLYSDGAPTDGPGWISRQVPSPAFPSRLLTSLVFAWRAYWWTRRHRPAVDIVHAHGDLADALAAVLIGRHLGRPAVCTCHASFPPARSFINVLRRSIYSCLDHVFCVSEHTASAVRAIGVPVGITVQHSGTRLERLRNFAGRTQAAPLIAAVGRLTHLKGYTYLIEAVRLLAREWPDLSVEIAGGGPLEDDLRATVADLPQVRLVGSLSSDEVYQLLGRAWLFCQSSVVLPGFTEGLPTTVIEAMAAGLPIVGTAVAGLPEVVTEGANGLLVPPGDAVRLAEALDRMLRDEALRKACAVANYNKASEWDWSRIAQRFITVCEQVVASRSLMAGPKSRLG